MAVSKSRSNDRGILPPEEDAAGGGGGAGLLLTLGLVPA